MSRDSHSGGDDFRSGRCAWTYLDSHLVACLVVETCFEEGFEAYLGASFDVEPYAEMRDMTEQSCWSLGEPYYSPLHFQTAEAAGRRHCKKDGGIHDVVNHDEESRGETLVARQEVLNYQERRIVF